jgi:hypothetical protein
MPTIPSSPTTWTGDSAVTFSIPAGTWASASWQLVGTGGQPPWVDNYSFPHNQDPAIATDSQNNMCDFGVGPTGSFNISVGVTTAQLADINAAAGGTLNANVYATCEGGATITACNLILAAMGAGAGTQILGQPDDGLTNRNILPGRILH